MIDFSWSSEIDDVSRYFKEGKSDKAVIMLNKLIADGDSYAEYISGVYHFFGANLEKDLTKAESIFKKGCVHYVEPCLRLGELYENKGQFKKAEDYYHIAAKEKFLWAYSGLIDLYREKNWEGASELKAQEWIGNLDNADQADWDRGKCCKPKNSLTRRTARSKNHE